MKVYAAGLVASALVLAGCGTAVYDKPGLTYEQWKQDDAACRRETDQADRGAYDRCMRTRGYQLRTD